MKTLIIFNHPYEGSFCTAILNAVTKGLTKSKHEVDIIHLDRDNFDPVMRAKDLKAFVRASTSPDEAMTMLDPQVLDYKKRLEEAEHLIFIFPIWWELMPALMKGFIDKLIFPGIAYKYKGKPGGIKMEAMINWKSVTMITTMNTPSIVYQLIFGNAVKKALLLGTFMKIGISKRKWLSFNMVKMVSQKKREKWLTKLEKRFSSL